MPRASVDIGSNSLVFLVLGDQSEVLHDESRIVSLGRGLGDGGQFLPDRMADAMDGFKAFATTAASLGVNPTEIRAIATSAARRASNATAFFSEVQSQTGIQVEVINGLEEARLTWRGALYDLPKPEASFAVVDLGGGSTEIVVGSPGSETFAEQISLEIGTVRLTEMFFGPNLSTYTVDQFNDMKAHIAAVVSEVDWTHLPKQMIAVAGTATTLCAMELEMLKWDRDAIHGQTLTLSALESWMLALLHSDPEQRQAWAAVSPKRANYLLAGAAVLHAVCESSGLSAITISDGGIRHGVLLDSSQNAQGQVR